jgi:hypothetical protein
MALVAVERDAVQHRLATLCVAQHAARVDPVHAWEACLHVALEAVEVTPLIGRVGGVDAAVFQALQAALRVRVGGQLRHPFKHHHPVALVE